jgi:hypothetical protein
MKERMVPVPHYTPELSADDDVQEVSHLAG